MLHACHVQQLLAVLTMHARITQSHMTQQQTNVQHVHTWISGQLHHSCQEFCHAAPLVRHLLAVPCCLSVIASAILRLRQAFKRLVTRPIARSVGLAGLPLPQPVQCSGHLLLARHLKACPVMRILRCAICRLCGAHLGAEPVADPVHCTAPCSRSRVD